MALRSPWVWAGRLLPRADGQTQTVAKKPERSPRRRPKADDGADALAPYRSKRHFDKTPEPRGGVAGKPPEGRSRFVVQRHRASRLHYDFRLEVDGVLVSWAVPKGPTLDPKRRNLAVHVEDHPIEYFDFEGVIPEGEYGGGDVIVWDWGTWSPAKGSDPAKDVEDGELHVDLEGEKLRGRFVLVQRDGKQWLLLHKRDDHAVEGWDPEDHLHSVKSGRTNDEVAEDPDLQWHSDKPAAEAAERVGRHRWDPPTEEELAALDDLGKAGTWTFQGHELKLDFTQNAINKTLVAPYSARPAPGAPVSVPIEWDELDDPDLRPDRWTIRTVLDRLAERGDPLARLVGRHQRLPAL